ncbi:bifunctional folylpolyglutamate synthase/dihydrofolate synthase [Lentilactobacillus kosonis]|uniref:bifunctional folylpolyglutamate synthase/dihydrofolate synthase n=1 Tax=Lentilactobacillus kosonis TaxID=2810561 RepID=UPI001E54D1F3|nr:Mur ligase family protein [Lentilactobacillus kosonis]
MDHTLPEGGPTEFEIITAMMFAYFAEGHADVVLVEVGLGGLYDSTNVITPIASAITSIGYDHMQILGNTLNEIAAQKAGIIKPNVPVVVGNIEDDQLEVIAKTATRNHSQLVEFGRDFQVTNNHVANWLQSFDYAGFGMEAHFKSSLLGEYQAHNAAVAISLYFVYCKFMGTSPLIDNVVTGISNTKWAGRFEKISDDPTVVIDGAHNVPAAKQISNLLNTSYSTGKIYILMAVLADKQAKEIVSEMAKVKNAEITLTTFNTPMNRRLFDANMIEQVEKNQGVNVAFNPDFKTAITQLKAKMNSEDLLLITGSLYFISEVRAYLLKYNEQI